MRPRIRRAATEARPVEMFRPQRLAYHVGVGVQPTGQTDSVTFLVPPTL
jgi:hypothetical protein